VSDDCEQRISEGHKEAEAGVALSLQKLLGRASAAAGGEAPGALAHCGCNAADSCLNISVCAATTGKDEFSVVAWNPQGHATTQTVRIPVTATSATPAIAGGAGAEATYTYSVTGPDGGAVAAQVVALDERTASLPLLYLNSFGMNASTAAAAKAALSNKATHVLAFRVETPAVGYAVYAAKKSALGAAAPEVGARDGAAVVAAAEEGGALGDSAGTVTAESDLYAITFDNSTGLATTITNKASGVSTPFSIEWGWYNSSVGGCTDLSGVPAALAEKACDNQKSGAYIFRPNSSEVFYPGPKSTPTLTIVEGPVVTEVYQRFSSWATHVIRLYHGQPYIEVSCSSQRVQ
jgi:alpha-mannosidase